MAPISRSVHCKPCHRRANERFGNVSLEKLNSPHGRCRRVVASESVVHTVIVYVSACERFCPSVCSPACAVSPHAAAADDCRVFAPLICQRLGARARVVTTEMYDDRRRRCRLSVHRT
jgi:hypothetical protein